MRTVITTLTLTVALMLAAVGIVIGQPGQTKLGRGSADPPLPAGQRIEARDGDLVVIEGSARVRIVRRQAAVLRVIHNPEEQWVVLLIDYVPANGGNPDGNVDTTYRFGRVSGKWPLEARWEGRAIIEDYMNPGPTFGPGGLGITFPSGLVQFFGPAPTAFELFADPSALSVMRFSGSGGGAGAGRETFDQAEPRVIESIRRSLQMTVGPPPGSSSSTLPFGVTAGIVPGYGSPEWVRPGASTSGEQPVRVGDNIAAPRRIHDVAPVYPDLAKQRNIFGVVILQIVIGTDGSVTRIRVQVSPHPMLEQPAIEAAKEWRYEPTYVDGKPVPVIMTVPVNFKS
jgi:TonB family protein